MGEFAWGGIWKSWRGHHWWRPPPACGGGRPTREGTGRTGRPPPIRGEPPSGSVGKAVTPADPGSPALLDPGAMRRRQQPSCRKALSEVEDSPTRVMPVPLKASSCVVRLAGSGPAVATTAPLSLSAVAVTTPSRSRRFSVTRLHGATDAPNFNPTCPISLSQFSPRPDTGPMSTVPGVTVMVTLLSGGLWNWPAVALEKLRQRLVGWPTTSKVA